MCIPTRDWVRRCEQWEYEEEREKERKKMLEWFQSVVHWNPVDVNLGTLSACISTNPIVASSFFAARGALFPCYTHINRATHSSSSYWLPERQKKMKTKQNKTNPGPRYLKCCAALCCPGVYWLSLDLVSVSSPRLENPNSLQVKTGHKLKDPRSYKYIFTICWFDVECATAV